MNRIAHILSWVLSPILIPTYAVFAALWITPLAMLPADIRWNVVIVTALVTCVLPAFAIMLLYWMKIISDPGLNNRTERLAPYVLTILCYCACAWYLYSIHSPHWMWMFMVAGGMHGCSIVHHQHMVENLGACRSNGRIHSHAFPHCRRPHRHSAHMAIHCCIDFSLWSTLYIQNAA